MDCIKTGNFSVVDFEKELVESKKTLDEKYPKKAFGTEEWIHVDKIKIDLEVQRDLQEHHVEKIVRSFDPAAFGRLHVTQRADGFYYCTNGQHRLNALRQLGFSYAPCIVVSLCSLADEGKNFININEQSAKVSNIDKYRIGCSAGVTPWLRVKECVDYIGAQVGTGEGRLSCVSLIYKFINNSKLETSRERDMYVMKKSMYILFKLYGIDGVVHSTLAGMCIFVKHHVVGGDCNVSDVIEKLQATNFKTLVSKANTMRENNDGRGKSASYMAFIFFTEYNSNMKRNKLPLRISI